MYFYMLFLIYLISNPRRAPVCPFPATLTNSGPNNVLSSPPAGAYHGGYDDSYGSPPYEGRRMGPPMRGRGGRNFAPGYGPPPPPPGEYGAHADSPVVMVYGLEPVKMNADKVFNVFCLYGNVERVSAAEVLCALTTHR